MTMADCLTTSERGVSDNRFRPFSVQRTCSLPLLASVNDSSDQDQLQDVTDLLVFKRKEPYSNQHPVYIRENSMADAITKQGKVPYGESSRKFRRTIFTYSDWVKHRSNVSTIWTLRDVFYSGVVRELIGNTLTVTASGILLILWNDFLVPLCGAPALSLPTLPFTLSSSALSLLLVFRTNSSYGRWTEARATWTRIITHSRNLVRMAATISDPADMALPASRSAAALDDLARDVWLFARSVMNRLSGPEDEKAYLTDLEEALSDTAPALWWRVLSASDRSMASLTQLSLSLSRTPIDAKSRLEIDKSVIILGDCLGTCEKIFNSPVPLVYTRHTARFLSIWLLLLPLTMYDSFLPGPTTTGRVVGRLLPQIAMVPTVMIMSLFLFGIEQLALQLEEPFSILPMQTFCENIRSANGRIIDWAVESAKEHHS